MASSTILVDELFFMVFATQWQGQFFQQMFLYLPFMKYFFFILSCFMLYLSCLPCSDSKECNEKTETNISVAGNHQQHEHDTESCTPFCTCSCCSITVYYTSIFKMPSVKFKFLSVKYALQKTALNTEVYYSIWQPPKIA